MNEEQAQQLLDEASGLYNDGNYDDAIAIWRRILDADPENERAREGIKMAELLTTEWEAGPAEATPAPAPTASPRRPADPAIAARVQQGVQRVRELITAGAMDAAREGMEALQQVAPDDPGVLGCVALVESAGNTTAYIDEQLTIARHFLILGEADQAGRACQKVLALDPGNAVAQEMIGTSVGAAPAEEPAPLELDDPVIEDAAADLAATADLQLPLDVPGAAVHAVEAEPLELPAEAAEAGATAVAAAGAGGSAATGASAPGTRVEALLAEGDRLRDEGKLDAAIDAWSRVFIIQDNHADAERRIDGARRTLEDQARQIESHLYRAEDLLGEGRLKEAREAFATVLHLRPTHAEARARIEDIDRRLAGDEPEPESIPLDRPPAPSAPPPARPSTDAIPLALDPRDIKQSRSTSAPRPPRPAAPSAAPRSGGLRVLLVAVVLIAALSAGGWYAWTLFFPEPPPNVEPSAVAKPSPAAPPASAAGAVATPATTPPPATGEPSTQASPSISPEDAKQLSRERLQSGIALFQAGKFREAQEQLRAALEADPTNFSAQDWLTKAEKEVTKRGVFEREIAAVQQLVDDRDFHDALYKLYRIEATDEVGRQKVDRWTRACWYNWGVVLMRANNPREAAEKFQEVLGLTPGDAAAAKHAEVAERYSTRPIDDSYEAYVERLELRPLD